MAVAHDAVSESHTGTTGVASVASFTWDHVPAGTPRSALVFTFAIGANPVTSVTYGTVSMTAIPYTAYDSDTEPFFVQAWFLDNCGTGTKAVVVNRTNNAVVTYAVCMTQTAASAAEVYLPGVMTQACGTSNTAASSTATGTGTAGLKSVDDGSPGTNSQRYMAMGYGGSSVLAAGTGSTSLTTAGAIDFGLYVICTYRETTPGQGARNVGSAAGTDDLALIALAVREIPPDPITGTGAGSGTASSATGAAAETMAGTGAGTGAAATAAGSGLLVNATGAGTQAAATASGAGDVGEASPDATGTGAGTQVAATATGAGAETFTGTGAATQVVQTAAGVLTETMTGTGAGTGVAATASGAGSETFTATGAGTQPAPSATGTGVQPEPVSGTGAGVQAAATASGAGIGGVDESPIVIVSGAYRPDPPRRKRLPLAILPPPVSGSGAGRQAVPYANGSATVNDDELVLAALLAA